MRVARSNPGGTSRFESTRPSRMTTRNAGAVAPNSRDVRADVGRSGRFEDAGDVRGNQFRETAAGRDGQAVGPHAHEPDEHERLRDEQRGEKGHEPDLRRSRLTSVSTLRTVT